MLVIENMNCNHIKGVHLIWTYVAWVFRKFDLNLCSMGTSIMKPYMYPCRTRWHPCWTL